MVGLDFKESCQIYPTSVDEYGQLVLGTPATVPCLLEQMTARQHTGSQDSIVGTPRLVIPGDNAFVIANNYRLEEMFVQANPFGNVGMSQWYEIVSVQPGKDLLLGDEVQQVECELKKAQPNYVS